MNLVMVVGGGVWGVGDANVQVRAGSGHLWREREQERIQILSLPPRKACSLVLGNN